MTCQTCGKEITESEEKPLKRFRVVESITQYREFIVESPNEGQALMYNWKILQQKEKYSTSQIESIEELT